MKISAFTHNLTAIDPEHLLNSYYVVDISPEEDSKIYR